MEADVVVVNHHLFFADVMLRDEGMGELLPACNAVIFDEAHQLPETASLFFGESVSTSPAARTGARHAGRGRGQREGFLELPSRRPNAGQGRARPAPDGSAARTCALRRRSSTSNKPLSRRHCERPWTPSCAELGATARNPGRAQRGAGQLLRRAQDLRIERWPAGRKQPEGRPVRWVEVFSQALALNATPLSIADIFQAPDGRPPAGWIFTSATLAVGGVILATTAASWACTGSTAGNRAVWGSPFDYPQQALLYAPENMPEPNSPTYADAVAARGVAADQGLSRAAPSCCAPRCAR
jgi:ATP-dependent DNA helicase DinG